MLKMTRLGMAALTLGVLLAMAAQEGGHRPYREKLPDGEVDWFEGWIRVTATAPIDQAVPKGKGAMDARRVALVKAQAAALRIAMRVPVDSERRLESFEALRVKVKGVVSGGQVLTEETRGKEFVLTLEVPVSGVRGLRSEVLPVVLPPEEPEPAPKPKPKPAPAPKATEESKVETSAEPAEVASVTVDASEAGVRPALFPRIVDPQGQEVYSVKTVGRLGASQKALAKYTIGRSEDGKQIGSMEAGPSLPLAFVAPGAPLWLLQASPEGGRKRGGGQTLMVKASGAKGTLRSDIVVTEETAKKLREAESASGVLSQAKVVVVVRSDVGGVEGRRRTVREAVEFARH